MSEHDVTAALRRARIVPVASFDSTEQARQTAQALARGGVRCLEVTFRTAAAQDAIAGVRELDGITVGAGTVLSVEQAHAAARAGAQFAVAPGSNPAVIDACAELGLPLFPGVATPSEIEAARARGRRTLKVFPAAQLGGPGFLRAVSATYPDVRFIPTGGIGAADFATYLELDCVLAVGGSWLAGPALLGGERYDEVERLARAATEALPPVSVA